jgi:hypothetical protein
MPVPLMAKKIFVRVLTRFELEICMPVPLMAKKIFVRVLTRFELEIFVHVGHATKGSYLQAAELFLKR